MRYETETGAAEIQWCMYRQTMMFATLLFVLMFTLTAGKAMRCPLGFINLGPTCYLFSHSRDTYADANSFCLFFGSHLADITSKNEDDLIRSHLLRHGKGTDFYIGATDLRSEGIWTWEHPLRKVEGYTNWQPGEPSNSAGKEHCMAMDLGIGYRWNDRPCKQELPFICEKSYI
ncbi:perlucin-like [Haliotis rufescens]|uniref:perlucin-like n=1 Tax=Haliotis rufescens TaxID=6454 RepID=UPI00201F28AD|nr:perlucin-like [Haliotis rufescens]